MIRDAVCWEKTWIVVVRFTIFTNKAGTIEKKVSELRKELIPEASIGFVHGQ